VEHLQSLVQPQTLVIQSLLKTCCNALNVLQKFTPLSAVMLYVVIDVKCASYLYYVLYKQVTRYYMLTRKGCLKNWIHAETTRTSANHTRTVLVLMCRVTTFQTT